MKKTKIMKNKVKNSIIVFIGAVSLSACLPNNGNSTTTTETTKTTESVSSSSEISETTIDKQITTSGNPQVTETSDSDNIESVCGDGILQPNEECDDGNLVIEDSCDDSCFKTRIVFRSSENVPSDFGGTTFADEICTMNAKRAKLGGNYKAWVSDSDMFSAPLFRFDSQDFQGWYLLPTNPPKKLAKGWHGLTNDFLVNWIDVSATGVESILTPEFVWTGTLQDGSFSEGNTCNGWTTTDASSKAQIGSVGNWNEEWTEYKVVECGFDKKIYCFQVN